MVFSGIRHRKCFRNETGLLKAMRIVFVVSVLLLAVLCEGSWVNSKSLKDESADKTSVVVKEYAA